MKPLNGLLHLCLITACMFITKMQCSQIIQNIIGFFGQISQEANLITTLFYFARNQMLLNKGYSISFYD